MPMARSLWGIVRCGIFGWWNQFWCLWHGPFTCFLAYWTHLHFPVQRNWGYDNHSWVWFFRSAGQEHVKQVWTKTIQSWTKLLRYWADNVTCTQNKTFAINCSWSLARVFLREGVQYKKCHDEWISFFHCSGLNSGVDISSLQIL